MTDVKIFNSPMFGELRVTRNEKGELLFCLKDVCDSLGLQVSATAKRLGTCSLSTTKVSNEIISHGSATGVSRDIDMLFVTEPDLYRCIFNSRKPTARKFQDWVFNEVLPSLRKTGAYVVAKEEDSEEDIIARGLVAAKAALARREQRIKELQSENEQSKQVINVQNERIAKDAPKVEYYDQTLAAENKLTAQQIANELHISARELNKKLAEIGIIFYKSNQWMVHAPYNKWDFTGTRTYTYYNSKTDTTIAKPYLVWNQRGRRFIHALYNNNFNLRQAIAEIKGNTTK